MDIVVDKHRVDGSRVRLAEVEVGDETGRVSLRARDDQIDLLQQVGERGAAVVLRNCTLELFQGKHIRLAVTKWGKITPYPDAVASTPVPPSKMNEDRFLSSIDLSAVAVDTSVHHAGHPGTSDAAAENDNTGYSHAASSARGGGRGMGQRKQARPRQQQQPQAQQPALQPYPGNVPVAYGDVMRYPGGLHGYGYVENTMDGYGGYRPRQADSMASAHMMLQQQYEMHQRQIHQMYQTNRPHHDSQQHATSMLTGLAPAGSFDQGFAPRNEMFLTHPPQGNLFASAPAPERTQAAQQGGSSTTAGGAASHFPASPKMNPRAATFDPSGKGGP